MSDRPNQVWLDYEREFYSEEDEQPWERDWRRDHDDSLGEPFATAAVKR